MTNPDPEDEAFEELSRRQGYWGLQGSRKHQILRYAENVENKGTSMIHPEITVTLTPDDLKLYDSAREIGLPSIVVSMYGDRIKKLLAEERLTEREACAKVCEAVRETIWEYHEEHLKAAACNVCTNLAISIRARGQA